MRFDCDNSVLAERLPAQPGLGLANLRRRLELLFGQDFRLDIDDAGIERTVAAIRAFFH